MSKGKEEMHKITDRMIVKTGVAAVLLCLFFGTCFKSADRLTKMQNDEFMRLAERNILIEENLGRGEADDHSEMGIVILDLEEILLLCGNF